jgi:hypothetical protein
MAPMMESDLVKRLMWSGLLAGFGALATVATQRAATVVWRRIFDEEPPE